MKLRISLLGLLKLVTLVGLACLWRCQSRRIAVDFAQAVAAGDYAAADAMFIDDTAIVADCMSFPEHRVDVEQMHQSVSQWLRGVCPIAVTLHHPGCTFGDSTVLCLVANARGVRQYCPASYLHTAQKIVDQDL